MAACAAASVSASPGPAPKVYAISDVHTDHAANWQWVLSLSRTAYLHDALILAGDVSDDTAVLEATLRECTERFSTVVFVPGNHDVWCARKASTPSADSYSKLKDLQSLCARLGVHTRPVVVGGEQEGATPVLLVPLLSWYHASFDTEPPVPLLEVPSPRRVMTDFAVCRWPAGVDDSTDDVAVLWDAANDEDWASAGFDPDAAAARQMAPNVISCSHFLPRMELVPEKRFLFYPNLPQAVGSTYLGSRVARLRPDVHVFGHTHFAYDLTLPDDGIRYLQAALSYPNERQSRMSTIAIGDIHAAPVLVYDSAGQGQFAPKYSCRWSEYYAAHPRRPHCPDIPPWVSKRYRRRDETQPPAQAPVP